MKSFYQCIPCFINQVLKILDKPQYNNKDYNRKILKEVLLLLSELDYNLSPPKVTEYIFEIIEKYYGVINIYKEIKYASNIYVMNMYGELKELIKRSDDPFDTAARLAITGNIIDFGANPNFDNREIDKEIENALKDKTIDTSILKEEIKKAKKILYIGDNAGEIVFDKMFIEELPTEKITFVVRGGPILNDVTMEDAKLIGLDKIVKVISNGRRYPGTVLKDCSEELKEAFLSSDLIISKGQGNYETLSELSEYNIVFMLRVKCPVVAANIGCKVGTHFIGKIADR